MNLSLSAPKGTHLTADLSGCSSSNPWMTQIGSLREACIKAIETCQLTQVGECFHSFPQLGPGQASGITGVVLLAESHLAIHTWPETGVVTLDIFICHLRNDNRERAHQLMSHLIQGFAPLHQHIQAIDRTIPSECSN